MKRFGALVVLTSLGGLPVLGAPTSRELRGDRDRTRRAPSLGERNASGSTSPESTLYRLELDPPVEPRPTHHLTSCAEAAVTAMTFPSLESPVTMDLHFKFGHEQLR